jgi:hypothetical protein
MKLGEILIAAGALTSEGLREALDWQANHGGRLGTNLLEIGLVDEVALGRALSRQLGVEVITGALQLDPQLAELLPPRTVVRQERMPWRMEKHRLKLIGCDPADVGLLDSLTQQIGKPCVAVVAPEFRIIQALRAHYGAVRELRPLDEGKVPEKALAERRLKRQRQEGKVAEEAPILLDEGAFAAIGAEITATHRVKAVEAAGDAAASELAAELREAGALSKRTAGAKVTSGPGRPAPPPSGRPPPPSSHALPAARPVPPASARPLPPSTGRPPPPSLGRPPPQPVRPPPPVSRPAAPVAPIEIQLEETDLDLPLVEAEALPLLEPEELSPEDVPPPRPIGWSPAAAAPPGEQNISATRATSPGVPRRQASAEALARLKAQLGLSDGGPGPGDKGKP